MRMDVKNNNIDLENTMSYKKANIISFKQEAMGKTMRMDECYDYKTLSAVS